MKGRTLAGAPDRALHPGQRLLDVGRDADLDPAARRLQFGLNKTVRVNGEPTGVVQSIGCPASRRWLLAFTNVYQHGSTIDSDTSRCRP